MAGETAARIGTRLRAGREERGWTRRKLVAEMDGLATENDVYRWETGKHRPRDDALAAAARALGLPIAYFLGPEPENQATPDALGALNGNGNGEVLRRLAAIEKTLAQILRNQEEWLALIGVGPERENYFTMVQRTLDTLVNQPKREAGRRRPKSSEDQDQSPPRAA